MPQNSELPTRRLSEWGVSRAEAELAVLAVHGRGQSPAFMRETAQRFGSVAARFYAPQAPNHTWYPRSCLEPIEHNQPDLDTALTAVDGALEALADAGFPSRRVVLWGFSQGACVLAQHMLTRTRNVAGLVLFTGGYIGTTRPALPTTGKLQRVPVVVRSVVEDPWVPPSRIEETAELFTSLGAHVDLRIEPGSEHVIHDEACAAATHLLHQQGG